MSSDPARENFQHGSRFVLSTHSSQKLLKFQQITITIHNPRSQHTAKGAQPHESWPQTTHPATMEAQTSIQASTRNDSPKISQITSVSARNHPVSHAPVHSLSPQHRTTNAEFREGLPQEPRPTAARSQISTNQHVKRRARVFLISSASARNHLLHSVQQKIT